VLDASLTGADLDEGSLGQVPTARTADSANTAGDANTLDSLDSADFLRTNAPAAGDLSGNYPNLEITANAVTSNEVSNNSLTGADLSDNSGNGTVASIDVANSSLTSTDILNGTIQSADVSSNFILAGALNDGNAGWNPDGVATGFNIDVPGLANANATIVLTLNDTGTPTNAVCGVTDISINGDFDMDCNIAPVNGIELNFVIFNAS
jgi:hypothetical protein